MKTQRLFDGQTDRYTFDFDACNHKRGYAQVDTHQDASYFGIWANPFKRVVVTYREGDITIERAESADEFRELMRGIKRAYDAMANPDERAPKNRGFKGIDTMCNESITAEFAKLGLAELCHERNSWGTKRVNARPPIKFPRKAN